MLKMTVYQKHIISLVIITLAVWCLSLKNGFLGDDMLLFLQNSFYSSFDNVKTLFSASYNTTSDNLLLHSQMNKGSGSVAYRPVLSMTYFFDAVLWGRNPFGFHLTNLIIHTVNVCLVYNFIFRLFGLYGLSFLTALFFSIHPVQSEAICAIGYRADLLVTLWVLLSAISWMAFRRGKMAGFLGAILFYLLALLSKESAAFLPFWFLVFDRWKKVSWKEISWPYFGFCLAASSYLYLYFIVFPNTSLHAFHMGWLEKLSVCGKSWTNYITYFLLPILVVPFPPLYYTFPRPLSLTSEIWFLAVFFVLAGILLVKRSTPQRPYHLMGLWAALFFFPASGIISNPNPVALRYLYFPGVGVYLILAVILEWIAHTAFFQSPTKRKKIILCSIFVGMCLAGTYVNINYWKNYFTMGSCLSKEFPDHYFGHLILGEFWAGKGYPGKAVQEFNIALDDRRANSPFLVYSAGLAYLDLKDYARARQAFEFLIVRGSKYGLGYRGMGMLSFQQEKYSDAVSYLEKALALDPLISDMILLLKAYDALDNIAKVEELLEKSKNLFPDSKIQRQPKGAHQ
ncbi:MAG: hypothetical protein HQL21_01350 [Candidatus Omnitrophica bacterium]|nr:hypothetical protein [Candidatus Omnitrophota bacterium]